MSIKSQLGDIFHSSDYKKVMGLLKKTASTPEGREVIRVFAMIMNDPDSTVFLLKKLRPMESTYPQDVQWALLFGYIYLYLNDYTSAANMFERALALDPSDQDAADFLAFCREELETRQDGGNPVDSIAPKENSMERELLQELSDIIGSGLAFDTVDDLLASDLSDSGEASPFDLSQTGSPFSQEGVTGHKTSGSHAKVPSPITFLSERDDDLPETAASIMSPEAWELLQYLNCPCTLFPPSTDPEILKSAYFSSVKKGGSLSLPVMIRVDGALVGRVRDNLAAGGISEPDVDKLKSYRNDISDPWRMEDGAAYLENRLTSEIEKWRREGLDDRPLSENLGEGEAIESFSGYWDYDTGSTAEILLAQLPLFHPWAVFSWLPLGPVGGKHSTGSLMAVARYWYLLYQAVPALVGSNVIEFTAPPVFPQATQALAVEQFGFCPRLLRNPEEFASLDTLADSLAKSTVWSFWW